MKSEVLSLGDNRAGDLARGGVDCNSTGWMRNDERIADTRMASRNL